ncbi:MAG TPA: hypothetical protein PKK05_27910, partial [Leptospiraceae bacterium]|nr:hypothetical protein [Leptospiraceae bacterium]
MRLFWAAFFHILAGWCFFQGSAVYAVPSYGWENSPSGSVLYINSQKVFDSREQLRSIPSGLSQEDKIHFALFAGEYFILRLDKDNLNGLLSLIRQEKSNLQFLETFLSVFWKIEKGEGTDAETKLEEYISRENNSYIQSIAKNLYQFVRRKGRPNVGISEIRSLGCVKSKEYYSICRSLQIRIQMEYLLNEENISPHRDLGNLDRLIAPLLEESELAYIPFLERIVPDLGARLAYLGFAYEAVHFQKLAILTERLAGRFEAVSYERLAFYQILVGDMQGAEDTLIFASKSLKSVSIAKNSLLLKSGMLAYVRRDYKQSLASMLELNLKFWGKTLRNPI